MSSIINKSVNKVFSSFGHESISSQRMLNVGNVYGYYSLRSYQFVQRATNSNTSYYNNNNNNNNNSSNNINSNNNEEERYVLQRKRFRLPYTSQDAGMVLLNWQFVRGNEFMMSLRESYIEYGSLTDKQLQALRNTMQSKYSNKHYSPFRPFHSVDPILLQIMTLSDESLSKVSNSQNNGTFKDFDGNIAQILAKYQQSLLNGYSLKSTQIRFAAKALKDALGDDFSINGYDDNKNTNEN